MGASQKKSTTFQYINNQPRPLAGHKKKLSVAGRSPKKLFGYRQQQIKNVWLEENLVLSSKQYNGPFLKAKVVLKLILIVIKKQYATKHISQL